MDPGSEFINITKKRYNMRLKSIEMYVKMPEKNCCSAITYFDKNVIVTFIFLL